MNISKKFLPFVIGIFLMAGSAFAQGQQMQNMQNNAADTVTDAEMEKFVAIAEKLQKVGQDIQTKVQDMVKEEGMEFQRFQKIMMSKQNPQMAKNVEVTQEEEQTIQKLQPKLQELQKQAQQQQMAVIQEGELSMQRFQQIAQAVQSDPQMMQRFREMSTDTSSNTDG